MLLVCVVAADREHEAHGASSAKFRVDHEVKGQHDAHADHRAVLGNHFSRLFFSSPTLLDNQTETCKRN